MRKKRFGGGLGGGERGVSHLGRCSLWSARKVLWRAQSIQEPLRTLGENSKGKQNFGPAGASVWNTPTVDPKRKVIYVGTGNSFGRIAADTSDSILAMQMEDGKIIWHHQEFAGDAFMSGCRPANAKDTNCPEKLGPDYDFGGSSVILQTVNGKDILVAAGKGGVAIGLDPDAEGKLVWRTQLWETQAPSAAGLVVWGGASDGHRVYYPLQQPGGGLKALQLTTGEVEWNSPVNADRRGQAGPGVVPGERNVGLGDVFAEHFRVALAEQHAFVRRRRLCGGTRPRCGHRRAAAGDLDVAGCRADHHDLGRAGRAGQFQAWPSLHISILFL